MTPSGITTQARLAERVKIVAEIREYAEKVRRDCSTPATGAAFAAIVNSVADMVNTMPDAPIIHVQRAAGETCPNCASDGVCERGCVVPDDPSTCRERVFGQYPRKGCPDVEPHGYHLWVGTNEGGLSEDFRCPGVKPDPFSQPPGRRPTIQEIHRMTEPRTAWWSSESDQYGFDPERDR